MNLRELEYIVAVADLGSFSQAADHCAVSQPTLSAQVKKLEEGLGILIFERTNKRVAPTDIGERIITSARRVLTEVKSIKETAQSVHDPLSGKFRLGAIPTLASYIFPALVPKLAVAMPNLKLILLEEKTKTLIEKLRQGTIDAALLALPISDDALISTPLFEDRFFLAVGATSSLSELKSVSSGILERQQLLLLDEGHCLRTQALEVCQLVGATEDPDFRATSLETLRQMVRAGSGVTLMPEIAMDRSDDGIRYIPFDGVPPSRTVGLVRRKTCQRLEVIDVIAKAGSPA